MYHDNCMGSSIISYVRTLQCSCEVCSESVPSGGGNAEFCFKYLSRVNLNNRVNSNLMVSTEKYVFISQHQNIIFPNENVIMKVTLDNKSLELYGN